MCRDYVDEFYNFIMTARTITVEPLKSGKSRPTSVQILEFVRISEYLI